MDHVKARKINHTGSTESVNIYSREDGKLLYSISATGRDTGRSLKYDIQDGFRELRSGEYFNESKHYARIVNDQ